MYAIAFLQGMVFYGPVATLYRQAAGLSFFQITLIESISLALCLLLEIPWGIAADKIGYRATMVICCALYFLSKIIFWKAADFAGFLAERILLSVAIAGISGVDTALLYLSCEKESSRRVFALYNNLQTSGLLSASLIYSVFIGSNFRLAGLLTAVSYGIAAVLPFGLTEVKGLEVSTAAVPGDFLSLLKQMGKNKSLFLLPAGIACLSETHQTVTVFLNQLQYVKCGLSDSQIGYVYFCVTAAGLTGIFSGRLARRFGTMRLLFLLFAAAAVSCLVLAWTANAWLSVLAVLLLRIGYSLFQPIQTDLQNSQVITANRATELSLNAMLIDSTGVGTNLLFGKLAEVSLPCSFLAGAALCAAGFFCLFLWDRSRSR